MEHEFDIDDVSFLPIPETASIPRKNTGPITIDQVKRLCEMKSLASDGRALTIAKAQRESLGINGVIRPYTSNDLPDLLTGVPIRLPRDEDVAIITRQAQRAMERLADFSGHIHSDPGKIPHAALVWLGRVSAVERAISKAEGWSGPQKVVELGPLAVGPYVCTLRTEDEATGMRNGILMPIEVLCMGMDVARKRAVSLVVAASRIASDEDLVDTFLRVYEVGDRLIRADGNDAFGVIKGIENLAKGRVFEVEGGLLPEWNTYNFHAQKLRSKTPAAEPWVMAMTHLLSSCDRTQSLEVFGLAKHFGHPILEVDETGLAMQETADETVDPGIGDEIGLYVARAFIVNFCRSKGRWPKFMIPPARGTAARRLHDRHVTSMPGGAFPITDLIGVRFSKEFDLDVEEDGLGPLDDKSICPPGKAAITAFFRRPTGTEAPNVLEAELTGSTLDPYEIIDRWARNDIPDDWKVGKVALKGGEAKKVGRGFLMAVREPRRMLRMLDKAIRDEIQPIFPQCAKGYKPAVLQTHLTQLSNSMAMFMEADYTGWNLHWHDENTHAVASMLDDLFGLPLGWRLIHPFFRSMTIMIPVGMTRESVAGVSHPSELPPGPCVWHGHNGGFEGQSQGLWELCTLGLEMMMDDYCEVDPITILQGDNVTKHFRVVPKDVPALLERRNQIALCAGHVLKESETEVYTAGVTMGKGFAIRGNFHKSVVKYAASALVPGDFAESSISSRVASPAGLLSSIGQNASRPDRVAWLVRVIEGLGVLALDGVRFGEFTFRSGRFLANMLPPMLGGYPRVPLQSMLVLGTSDPLSAGLASDFLEDEGWARKAVQRALTVKLDRLDRAHLLTDPYSVPLNRPSMGDGAIARPVERVLRGSTSNGRYAPLFDDSTRADTVASILQVMESSPEVYAPYFTLLYKTSPSGVSSELIRRFTSTGTLIKLAKNKGYRIRHAVASAEVILFNWVTTESQLSQETSGAFRGSPYHAARALRDRWGVQGLTGMTTVSPLQAKILELSHPVPQHSVVLRRVGPAGSNAGYYRGVKTKTNRETREEEVVVTGTALHAIKRLMLVASQVKPSGALARLTSDIVRLRTGYDYDDLERYFPKVVGGTADHRASVMEANSYNPAVSDWFPSMCTVSTDSFSDKRDLPLAMQEGMLTIQSVFASRASTGLMGNILLRYDLTGVNELTDPTTSGGTYTRPIPMTSASSTLVRPNFDITTRLHRPTCAGLYVIDATTAYGQRLAIAARAHEILLRPNVVASGGRVDLYVGDWLDRLESERVGLGSVMRGLALAVAFAVIHSQALAGVEFHSRSPLAGELYLRALQVCRPAGYHIAGSPDLLAQAADAGLAVKGGQHGAEALVANFSQGVACMAEDLIASGKMRTARFVVSPTTVISETTLLTVFLASRTYPDASVRGRSWSRSIRAAALRGIDKVNELRFIKHLSIPIAQVLAKQGYMVSQSDPRALCRRFRELPQPEDNRTIVAIPGPNLEYTLVPAAKRSEYSDLAVVDMAGRVDPGYLRIRGSRLCGGAQNRSRTIWADILEFGHGLQLHVGTGQGGSAAVAISRGYEVVGLELDAGLPREGRDHYVPEEVRMINGHSRFSWSKSTLENALGWYRSGGSDIMHHRPSHIVVAIEGHQTTIEDIRPIIESGFIGRLYWRMLATDEVARRCATYLAEHGRTRIHHPAAVSASFEVVVECQVVRRIVHVNVPMYHTTPRIAIRGRPYSDFCGYEELKNRILLTIDGSALHAVYGSINENLQRLRESCEVNTRTRSRIPEPLLRARRQAIYRTQAMMDNSLSDDPVVHRLRGMYHRLVLMVGPEAANIHHVDELLTPEMASNNQLEYIREEVD